MAFSDDGSFMFLSLSWSHKVIKIGFRAFPQQGKFYTLAGRYVSWEVFDGENVTTSHDEDIDKWSIQNVVGDVAFVNSTFVDVYIRPQTGENYTETYDFDYQIATNRTILSVHWNDMLFTTAGFVWSGEEWLDMDVGEHSSAWFPADLYVGAYVLVGWFNDRNFADDMLFEVVGDEVIQVIGEKQDCWLLQMPPSVTVDGLRARTETYWVDKDTGIPLKLYGKQWALDGSSGWDLEDVLVHTNIDLGPESTQPPSPTYTLTVPTSPGFPEAGKFYTWYHLAEGWFMSGATNITYYEEGLFAWLIAEVTDDVALVYRIQWLEHVDVATGELENVVILYYNYTIDMNTREIMSIAGSLYWINMTSLTYTMENPLYILGDIGEETYCWLPTNVNIGSAVNITRWRERYNATYTVIDEKIVNTLGNPQASWILHMPITPSIDGTWNCTQNWYSDKDVGIPLGAISEGWAVDGNEAYIETLSLIDMNVYLGPSTYVFQAVADSQTFNITVVTNSTIPTQTFNFSQGEKKISFNVTGSSGTAGFCNVTIPKALLYAELDDWIVLIDGASVSPIITENSTHSCLYFTYAHSTHEVQIIGTWVIGPPPPPLSVSISPLSASLVVGQSVTFTSTVSGGVTPYSYQWYLDGAPVSGATSNTWTFAPTTTGSYIVYLNVTDNMGNTAKSNEASVTVAAQLTASISPMSASVLVGQPVAFTSTVSGGYTPYSYQWYLNGNPVSGANATSWTFTPTAGGIYYIHLKVTDAKSNTAQSETARITVATVPVGGYSVPIQVHTKAEPILPYIALVATLTAIFTKLRPKAKRKR
jgi:hypothetical protein